MSIRKGRRFSRSEGGRGYVAEKEGRDKQRIWKAEGKVDTS